MSNPTGLERIETDALITELENRGVVNARHVVNLDIGSFTMKHTMRCQPDLFNCDIHKAINEAYDKNHFVNPWNEGAYYVEWKTDGSHRKLQLERVSEAQK